MTREIVDQAVRSAKLTADAWEEVVEIFVTVECEWQAGGRVFSRRSSSRWNPVPGQPHRSIAAVLPAGYFR